MIVIEGADNTGKTTLIEQLSKEFNRPVIKSYRPKNLAEIERFHNWAKAAPDTPILDRHPAISDFIYGNILRGDSHSTPSLIQFLRQGLFLIYCDPPVSVTLSTYNDRPQLEGTHENIERILSEYKSLMAQLEPDFVYDFTQPKSFRALCNHIQRRI